MTVDKPELIEDTPAVPQGPDAEQPEAKVVIPPREWEYVRIKPGQTLEELSSEYERPIESIIEKNKINPNYLFPNQWVWV